MWSLVSRSLAATQRRNLYMAEQKTAHEITEGQDKLLASMSRFAKDGDCVNHLQAFKSEVQQTLTDYRGALVHQYSSMPKNSFLSVLNDFNSFQAGGGISQQDPEHPHGRQACRGIRRSFDATNHGQRDGGVLPSKGRFS